MVTYIVRRLGQAVFLLFLLSIMFFLLVHFQPGGPCASQQIGCIQAQHLDQPIANQYVIWVSNTVRGNFGLTVGGQPVSQEIAQKLPPTIVLIGTAVVLQQLIALPLGVLAAVRPYSLYDSVLTVLSYIALSIPSFALGLVFLNVFALKVGWFPLGRNEDVSLPLLMSADWWSALLHSPRLIVGDLARHLFLPVTVFTMSGIAVDSRFMRSAMLQVMHQEYIRTATAKGLRRRRVIFKHAFRNALLPVLTNFGLYLPALIGGTVVVEMVFNWGGLGYAFGAAVGGGQFIGSGQGGDFAFLQGTLLLSAVLVLLVNLLVDLAYVWLDPRIRYDAAEGG